MKSKLNWFWEQNEHKQQISVLATIQQTKTKRYQKSDVGPQNKQKNTGVDPIIV